MFDVLIGCGDGNGNDDDNNDDGGDDDNDGDDDDDNDGNGKPLLKLCIFARKSCKNFGELVGSVARSSTDLS